jgi:hypothetical protein
MRANTVNRNAALFTVGIKSQELLSASDSAAFLKSLVEDFNPRCRTTEQYTAAAFAYLEKWRQAGFLFIRKPDTEASVGPLCQKCAASGKSTAA